MWSMSGCAGLTGLFGRGQGSRPLSNCLRICHLKDLEGPVRQWDTLSWGVGCLKGPPHRTHLMLAQATWLPFCCCCGLPQLLCEPEAMM